MTHKIEYKYDGNGVCYTECPHGESPNVGSAACEECKHFVANNEEWNYVACGFPEGGGV